MVSLGFPRVFPWFPRVFLGFPFGFPSRSQPGGTTSSGLRASRLPGLRHAQRHGGVGFGGQPGRSSLRNDVEMG